MSYSITVYRPSKLLYVRIVGELTVEEMQSLAEESIRYTNDGETYHAIVDLQGLKHLPANLPMMLRSFRSTRTPNPGFTAIVSSSKLFSFLGNAVLQAAGAEVRHCNSISEALIVLQRVDPNMQNHIQELIAYHDLIAANLPKSS